MVVAAADAGEDPQGMHPNQMAGNLEKKGKINITWKWQGRLSDILN